MVDEFRAFWAVIPATVLDDMNIPANAKILYGVTSTLMQREGYCWATNAQLAAAMHCSEDVISRWVSALAKAGHIRVQVTADKTNGGKLRRIYPALPAPEGYSDGCPSTYPDKNQRVLGQKSESIYIDLNNNKKIKKKEKESSPTSVEQSLFERCAPYGEPVGLAMRRFLQMRAEIKKPIKSKQAATLLWHKLADLSRGDAAHMVALLDKATECQWLSLYQLKDDELRRLCPSTPDGTAAVVDLSGLRFE